MLMLACSSQKDPAEQVIAKMDTSLDAIHDNAAKYAPDTLKSVESQVSTSSKVSPRATTAAC